MTSQIAHLTHSQLAKHRSNTYVVCVVHGWTRYLILGLVILTDLYVSYCKQIYGSDRRQDTEVTGTPIASSQQLTCCFHQHLHCLYFEFS